MNALSPDQLILLLVIIAVLVIGLGFFIVRHQRTVRLRRKFGAEYDLAVAKYRSRSKAEAELVRTEQRLAQIKIVELSSADGRGYSLLWESVQSRFVDDPRASVADADHLVREVMQKRGYPVAEFDNLGAYLSVRYPGVVSHYRAARNIASQHGDPMDTEQLRRALVHYRSLLDELLGGTSTVTDSAGTPHNVPVHS